MGLFSRPKPEESAPLTPAISQERLIALFKERGWHYFVDSDNDLGGTWDDDTYYFMLRGKDQEILHIQSMWHLSIPIERLEEVRAFIREWPRQKLWRGRDSHFLRKLGRLGTRCNRRTAEPTDRMRAGNWPRVL